jgi:uncharacterized protein (TIGR03084 family)
LVVAIVDDFRAEVAALDTLLADLSPAQWLVATPAEGWDVRDCVTHLAVSNEFALECVRTGKFELMARLEAAGSVEAYERDHLGSGRAKPGAAVRAWWLGTNADLADALDAAEPDVRIPWGPNTMSLPSFTTARLMETWAHGLDCFAAAGVAPVDTARLHHIAHLGLRTLPYAFGVRGLTPPGPVRLELTAPDGATWRLGPDDAPSWVSGTASDWCRVATLRDRDGERSRLVSGGPDGDAVIANAQAYLSS